MISNLTLIYKGDGVFRAQDAPVEFELEQAFQANLTPIEFLLDDQEYAPSEEAVWASMGMFNVGDPELARYLAESDELSEWNQFLYSTSDESLDQESKE